jgi:zeaxanthin glucosyltransferase
LLILNTTLESLAQGVPMVAIPIAFDQPGISARIAHHGVGEFVEIENLTAGGLSGLIESVLSDPAYRERYFRRLMAKTSGLDVAADVIERAFGLA